MTVGGVQVDSIVYNAAGMRTQVTDADSGLTKFSLDALGRIFSQTDANNEVTTFGYDTLNRLKTRVDGYGTANAVTSTWSWDPTNGVGQLAMRTRGGFSQTLSYDTAGRVDDITTTINVTGFPGNGTYAVTPGYSAGQLTSMTWPGSTGVVAYAYNAAGYLDQVSRNGTVVQNTASLDAFGNPTHFDYGNGTSTDFGHDVLGRVNQITTGPSSTPGSLQDLLYTWRSNGSLYQRTDARGTADTSDDWVESFGYDSLERLESATTAKSSSTTRILNFNYDITGNLELKTSSVSGDLNVTNYQYTGASPHQLSDATIGGIHNSFAYDSDGNITGYSPDSGDGTAIHYNTRSEADDITLGPSSSPTAEDIFSYGPDGHRFLKHATWNDGTTGESWTLYLLDGKYEATFPVSNANVTEREQVRVTGTVVSRHTTNADSTTSDVIEYDYRDQEASINVIADASGNVVEDLAYDPFGGRRANDWSSDIGPTALQQIEASSQTTNRGYTDHEHLDRIGLIHMNGRIYDPRIGRFLQPDPIVGRPSFSQNYNRYVYVYNNPESYTDLSGLDPGPSTNLCQLVVTSCDSIVLTPSNGPVMNPGQGGSEYDYDLQGNRYWVTMQEGSSSDQMPDLGSSAGFDVPAIGSIWSNPSPGPIGLPGGYPVAPSTAQKGRSSTIHSSLYTVDVINAAIGNILGALPPNLAVLVPRVDPRIMSPSLIAPTFGSATKGRTLLELSRPLKVLGHVSFGVGLGVDLGLGVQAYNAGDSTGVMSAGVSGVYDALPELVGPEGFIASGPYDATRFLMDTTPGQQLADLLGSNTYFGLHGNWNLRSQEK